MTVVKAPLELPLFPDLKLERKLWHQNIEYIAGVDEAGRGAWAGPVYAGAVILPNIRNLKNLLKGVQDSKLMKAEERSLWESEIKTIATCWAVGAASHEEIDQMGIIAATRLAMVRALQQLMQPPYHVLIDALPLPEYETPQTILIKGDRLSLSIAAASILAKTARDAWMIEQDLSFPDYGFAAHKGYGTKRHQHALSQFGPCSIHRKSYKPFREGLLYDENLGDESLAVD